MNRSVNGYRWVAAALLAGCTLQLPTWGEQTADTEVVEVPVPAEPPPPIYKPVPPVGIPAGVATVKASCFAPLPRPRPRPAYRPSRPAVKSMDAGPVASKDKASKPEPTPAPTPPAEPVDALPPPMTAPPSARPPKVERDRKRDRGSADEAAESEEVAAPDMEPAASEPAPPAPAAAPSPEPEAVTAPAASAPAPEPEPVASKSAPVDPPTPTAPAPVDDVAPDEIVADEADDAADQEGDDLDWGAIVHLSNDDSMSLASAQRVLWAAQHGEKLAPEAIRPHELLNWFQFATDKVPYHSFFSVKAVARQLEADVLGMAFAVRAIDPPRLPLDATVLIDRSGSMREQGRMETVKRGLHAMAEHLVPGDRVDIVLFDHLVCAPLEDFVVGRDDMALLTSTIDKIAPRGATNLSAALKEGYRLATSRLDEVGRNRRVMVMTDAWVNKGELDAKVLGLLSDAYDRHGVRLTGVGVGRDFHDEVLDGLTEAGKGAYVFLGSDDVVDRVMGSGLDAMTRTVAHDVRFMLDLPDSLALERFYGEEASTRKEDVQPIHYYAGTTQLFLQDLKMRRDRLDPDDVLELAIAFRDARDEQNMTQVQHWTLEELIAADPANLHKARALMAWTDLLSADARGEEPCTGSLDEWRVRSQAAWTDPEIRQVWGLVATRCEIPDPTAEPG